MVFLWKSQLLQRWVFFCFFALQPVHFLTPLVSTVHTSPCCSEGYCTRLELILPSRNLDNYSLFKTNWNKLYSAVSTMISSEVLLPSAATCHCSLLPSAIVLIAIFCVYLNVILLVYFFFFFQFTYITWLILLSRVVLMNVFVCKAGLTTPHFDKNSLWMRQISKQEAWQHVNM